MKLQNLFEDTSIAVRKALRAKDWRNTNITDERLVIQTTISREGLYNNIIQLYIITDVPPVEGHPGLPAKPHEISEKQYEQLMATSFKHPDTDGRYYKGHHRHKTREGWSNGGRMNINVYGSWSAGRTRSKKIQAITWKEFVNMVEAEWPYGDVDQDDDFSE